MSSCETLLQHALALDSRLDYLQLDPLSSRLTVGHHASSPRELDATLEPLMVRLTESLGTCPYREDIANGKRCRACRNAKETVPRFAPINHAAIGSGIITVARTGGESHAGAATAVWTLAPGAVRAQKRPSPAPRLWGIVRAVSMETVFVVLTAIGLIGGGIVEAQSGLSAAAWSVYALAFLFGGYFGLTSGIQTLREGKIDVDLLMILAAAGAAAIGAPFEGALLLFLFSLSNVLQDFALERTRNAIEALVKLRPATAEVQRNGQWVELAIEQIAAGERLLVRPGGRIGLDGTVVAGQSAVDESVITGESRLIDKEVGDSVLAGTINGAGSLQIEVTREAKNSTLARIVALVEQARENKAKTEHFLETFEQWYTIVVIAGTVVAALVPVWLLGHAWGPTLYRAITLMVAASPCALIISTPASVLSALGNAARRGILFKGGVYVEQAARTKVVAFDKTGTLTFGTPEVTEIETVEGFEREELLRIAAALESHSEHALAHAIRTDAERRGLPRSEAESFQSVSGNGVEGVVEGYTLRIGNRRYIEPLLELDSRGSTDAEAKRLLRVADDLRARNRTVVLLARGGASAQPTGEHAPAWRLLGLIALSDRIRPEARAAIQQIRAHGVQHVVMLTGDNEATARAIAAEAGVDEVVAELLPEHKLEAIGQLRERFGPLAMVGDGVNDAPALAQADLAIAMGGRGTDVAMETADVILMGDSLENIAFLLNLSRATRRTLVTNLGIALGLIGLMMVGIFAIDLPLPLAVLGHEGGTVLVSLNGLRLLWFGRSRVGR